MKRSSIYAVAFCAAFIGVVPTARADNAFNNAYIQPPTAKVGYHYSGWIAFGDAPGHCAWNTAAWSVQGLPPGLTAGSNSTTIDGTPRQAGDWYVTVSFSNLSCKTGSDLSSHGDRTVRVPFHIDP